jgi:hypothetical protein
MSMIYAVLKVLSSSLHELLANTPTYMSFVIYITHCLN